MRAVVLDRFGGPEVLSVRELPDPEPARGEVLVRVRASALNRADLLQRLGRYAPPADAPQEILGIEYAGEIVRVGEGVAGWRTGQRVFGIAGGGAHAEMLVAPQETLAEVPDALDWTRAGATPEAFITAHDALVTQAALGAGETVLIHACGSGVGLAAIQVARIAGAVPFGTSRTPEKIERARGFGLEGGLALGDDLAPLAGHVSAWTDQRGVDVVLDLVGGAYTPASVLALGHRGRLILAGLLGGRAAELDLGRILSRRLTIRGTVLRARSRGEKGDATRAFARDIIPALASGRAAPVVDSVFPLERIADAHRRMESNESFGKIVLAI